MTQSESELRVGEEERDALVLNGETGQSELARLATKNVFMVYSEASQIDSLTLIKINNVWRPFRRTVGPIVGSKRQNFGITKLSNLNTLPHEKKKGTLHQSRFASILRSSNLKRFRTLEVRRKPISAPVVLGRAGAECFELPLKITEEEQDKEGAVSL